MALSLTQSDVINEMAKILYDFLPGTGSASWSNHTTFPSVAQQAGVGQFWPGGSKLKALVHMLSRTLDEKPTHFERLVVCIVRAGLTYRAKNPVTKSEVLTLNDLIKRLGFKFPDLWDPAFLDSLAAKAVAGAATAPAAAPVSQAEHRRKLDDLRVKFYVLASQSDRQAAGTAFEGLLSGLFTLFGLQPRLGYRIIGEQIDGSFVLDQEIYLLEAKWEKPRLSAEQLYVFREKVTGKSNVSRGVFIALNGFTEGCLDAVTRGKQAVFFLLDGSDLVPVLEGQMDLVYLLREKLRLLAEEGAVLGRIPPTAV